MVAVFPEVVLDIVALEPLFGLEGVDERNGPVLCAVEEENWGVRGKIEYGVAQQSVVQAGCLAVFS